MKEINDPLFLHNHPQMEVTLGLGESEHVIVDIDEWRLAREIISSHAVREHRTKSKLPVEWLPSEQDVIQAIAAMKLDIATNPDRVVNAAISLLVKIHKRLNE